eukprot:NODE_994_length_2441_cov_0.146456.p1 type:complete len:495 gc:universal NODE_994_length_2441_cov_0.146456:231-1715(+)
MQLFLFLVSSVSIDCENLRSLAISLRVDIAQPAIMTALEGDCCLAAGITCVNSRVTAISWGGKSLTGSVNTTIPLPSTLVTLNLFSNPITGPITSWNLPTPLTTFAVYATQLNGSIPNPLPPGLVNLKMQNSLYSGPIPTLPLTLQYIYLQRNRFTGGIKNIEYSSLVELVVHGNSLTGDVPAMPTTMKQLMLGYNGFPGNHFSGIVRLDSPTLVRLNENWITDLIIRDATGITFCDLSYTPLLNNPSVTGLSCTKTGMYDARLLPNTYTTAKPSATVSSDLSVDNSAKSLTSSTVGTIYSCQGNSSNYFLNLDSMPISFLNLFSTETKAYLNPTDSFTVEDLTESQSYYGDKCSMMVTTITSFPGSPTSRASSESTVSLTLPTHVLSNLSSYYSSTVLSKEVIGVSKSNSSKSTGSSVTIFSTRRNANSIYMPKSTTRKSTVTFKTNQASKAQKPKSTGFAPSFSEIESQLEYSNSFQLVFSVESFLMLFLVQ